MVLCDTNILIEYYKGNEAIRAALLSLGPDNVVISIVTAAELFQGALNRVELQRVQAHLRSVTTLPLTQSIGQEMLRLMGSYCLSHRIQFPDALIAATALHHGLPLYTLNRKDFRYIPNLTLYEPFEAVEEGG